MYRGMWPGYTFSRFHERFWHLAHFRNAQKHVAQLFIFSLSRAFLAFCPISKHTEACGPVIHFLVFMSVFGIWSIFEIHRGMWPDYIFFVFISVFLHLLASNRFGILPIFEMYRRHVLRSYFFSLSCTTSKKLSK